MYKSHFILSVSIAALSGIHALAETPRSAEIAELRQQVEALTSKLNDLQQQVNQGRLAPVFSTPASGDGKPVPGDEPPGAYTAPKETNLNIFNPEISAAVDFIASYSRRADNANFIVRDAEIMLQANVDQLAHAYVVFNAETELLPLEKTDAFEEISLGIEEAAIETTALPYGLQVKAGQFFADLTRLGKVHSHELPFTDRPLSLDSIVGGEAKGRGLEISWIPPLGHYVRFTAGAVDHIGAEPTITSRLARLDGAEGDTFRNGDHRGFGNVLYYGRAATIFELGSQAQLHIGGNHARGRDAGTRQLTSADFKFAWTPRADAYDLFELSGEYLWGRSRGGFGDEAQFDASAPGGVASAHGGYVYAQYRFGKQWQPGVRFDYLRPETWGQIDLDGNGEPDAVARGTDAIKTCSAYLNYHFSEFNRLRLQVNYVSADTPLVAGANDDWQAFLQWTIALGPHKHPFSP